MNALEHLTDKELTTYYQKIKAEKLKSNRFEKRKTHGFDLKFSYNIIRLISEAEMIFSEGDLDLQRNREQLKAIRRGEWTIEQIQDYVSRKEKLLEEIHATSKLPVKPDMNKVKELLLQCLEHHYGSMDKFITVPDRAQNLLLSIKQLMSDAGY